MVKSYDLPNWLSNGGDFCPLTGQWKMTRDIVECSNLGVRLLLVSSRLIDSSDAAESFKM